MSRARSRETGSSMVPAKRPEGRGGHLSEQEKQAIRLAYLESGGTKTFKQLATEFNVNRDTVSACCKGPAFRQLERQFEAEIRQAAVDRLKSHILPAADAWGTAIPIAAKKGDHRPARELLQHAGIVEPNKDAGTHGLLVLVRTVVDGVEKMSDGTAVYDIDPETGEVLDLPTKRDHTVMIGCPTAAIKLMRDFPISKPAPTDGETIGEG